MQYMCRLYTYMQFAIVVLHQPCGSTAKGLVTVHLQAECGGHRGTAAGGRMQTPTGDASLHGRSQ